MDEEERKRRHREDQKRYMDAHPEQRLRAAERTRQWSRDNQERIRQRRSSPEYREQANARARSWARRTGYYRKTALANRGITADEYQFLLESQGGGCYFCGTAQEANGRSLSVDHEHSTGRTRGVLCYACNISLGYAERGMVSRLLRQPEKLSSYLGYPSPSLSIRASASPRKQLIAVRWLAGEEITALATTLGINRKTVHDYLREAIAISRSY